MHSQSLLCGSLGLAAALVAAQDVIGQSNKDPAAGYGAQTVGPIGLDPVTGNDGHLGVVELNGLYYVTSRGLGGPPHVMYTIDAQGNQLNQVFQDPGTSSSSWGWRDGCTDGTNLAFGYEAGINFVDTNGLPVTTFNGQTVNPFIVPGTSVGTQRALALNPNGNGGVGSLWTANFGSDLVEIDFAGNALTVLTIPTTGTAWSAYGLAWDDQGTADPTDDTLWVNSAPNQAEIAEIDPQTGQFTGNTISRNHFTSAQGGLDGVSLGPNGAFGLVGLDQSGPDTFITYRVDRDNQVPGENEAILQSAIGTGPLDNSSPKWFLGLPVNVSFNFDITNDPTLANRPGVLIANFGANLQNGTVPGFPEVVAQVFSTPQVAAGLLPFNITATPSSFSLPSFGLSDQLRLQVVYLEPNMRSNLAVATNQVLYERNQIVVMASGLNSFNDDVTSGYFSVTNYSIDPITEVTMDWTTSSNTAHAMTEFDTDQTGMNDQFYLGNGTLATCTGTYRNNSDATTGLVYDAMNTVIGVCDPNSNCGWIGTNAGNGADDWRTLLFRFTDFGANETFEFDSDTDEGPTGGDECEGLVITIKTLSGRTLGPAELVRIPGQSRSVLVF